MTDIVRSSDGATDRPAYRGGDDYDQHQKHAVLVKCSSCGESFYMTAIKVRCAGCLTVPDATGHSG